MVRVTVALGGETAVVTSTPVHPYATAHGYVSARHLQAGAEILRAGEDPAVVRAVEFLEGEFEIFNLVVDQDECFHVSPLALLVHNNCPAGICLEGSQTDLEDFFDHAPGYERLPDPNNPGGDLPRQPGFIDSRYVGFEHNMDPGVAGQVPARDWRRAEQLGIDRTGWYRDEFADPATAQRLMDDLGIDPSHPHYSELSRGNVSQLQRYAQDAARDDVRRATEGMTYPDDVRRLTRPDGSTVDVAIELKTPLGGTTQDFLLRHEQSILDQATNRYSNMPGFEHEMVIDLRNTGETPEQALQGIRGAMENSNLSGLGEVYQRVRFMTGNRDAYAMSEVFDMPNAPRIGGRL